MQYGALRPRWAQAVEPGGPRRHAGRPGCLSPCPFLPGSLRQPQQSPDSEGSLVRTWWDVTEETVVLFFTSFELVIKQKKFKFQTYFHFLSLWLQVNSLQTVYTNVYKIFLLQAYRWAHWLRHHRTGAQSHTPPGPHFPAAWDSTHSLVPRPSHRNLQFMRKHFQWQRLPLCAHPRRLCFVGGPVAGHQLVVGGQQGLGVLACLQADSSCCGRRS